MPIALATDNIPFFAFETHILSPTSVSNFSGLSAARILVFSIQPTTLIVTSFAHCLAEVINKSLVQIAIPKLTSGSQPRIALFSVELSLLPSFPPLPHRGYFQRSSFPQVFFIMRSYLRRKSLFPTLVFPSVLEFRC